MGYYIRKVSKEGIINILNNGGFHFLFLLPPAAIFGLQSSEVSYVN
jgi:hypothetical protein